MPESGRRVAAVNALSIMDEAIYYRDVYLPILNQLGVDRREMRDRAEMRKSAG